MYLDDGGKPVFEIPTERCNEELMIDWYKYIIGSGGIFLIIIIIISII